MMFDIMDWDTEALVTIMRGGQSAAHIMIRSCLKMPNGVFYPKTQISKAHFYLPVAAKKIVFIEDIVSTGRTYEELERYMDKNQPNIMWRIAPVIVDGSIDLKRYHKILTYGMMSNHWIVSPFDKKGSCPEGEIVHSRDFIGTDQEHPHGSGKIYEEHK
jgi:hypoxanthine phosphoribosyltransferase